MKNIKEALMAGLTTLLMGDKMYTGSRPEPRRNVIDRDGQIESAPVKTKKQLAQEKKTSQKKSKLKAKRGF